MNKDILELARIVADLIEDLEINDHGMRFYYLSKDARSLRDILEAESRLKTDI